MAGSDDALREYRDKRDPRATNEPFAGPAPANSPGGTWVGDFVVHLHAATRRHYDLRLQVGGVLKSFAVPRGPSLDPADKRLAVQTEDHPIEYLDFEDVIPDGSYGAGPMIVWDIGRIRWLENTPEFGLPKGKLDFELHGRKLRGRFALVETTARVKPTPKQRQWLLLKKQDAHCEPNGDQWVANNDQSVFSGLRVEDLQHRERFEEALLERARQLGAQPGPQPDFARLQPMLCANEGATLDDPKRLYELKLDGVRILAERHAGRVRLKYRKPNALTQSYPDVGRALATLFGTDFVIDGEIVSFDEQGKPVFGRLAPRIAAKRPADIRRAVVEVPVVYMVFDLLRFSGHDLTGLPLLDRKRLLSELVPGKGVIRLLDHIVQHGRALFELAESRYLEGVVSKLASSRYAVASRNGDWVKHKCRRQAQFVVVGWIEGKGSRGLGALELATYREQQLVYRGRVGGGMSDAVLRELPKVLAAIAREEKPDVLGLPAVSRGRHWVAPQLVVRVEYLEWTEQGNLRMPIFIEVLTDGNTQDCVAAPPAEYVWLQEHGDEGAATASTTDGQVDGCVSDALPSSAADPAARARLVLDSTRAALTNLDKVFWPEERYTKGDLIAYYAAIAPTLMPYLEDRPVMLVRYPDGIEGKNFYQWNTPKGTPNWISTLPLRSEERDGKDVTTFLVDHVDVLLHIANLGCIPIHVLASRKDSLDYCDFLTIDFDLGEQPLTEAIKMALALRELLEELGLSGFPKTSGQSGLHVFIPMGPNVPFPFAKGLLELLARVLQSKFPDVSTMERRVRERGGRIYIDTGQTGRSRTIVAPYSVRAHPGGRVSTPLLWEEMHLALKPEAHTMFTVPHRVASVGDAMRPMLDARPDLLAALDKLERWVRS